jgi:hypothetical protein
MSAGSLEFIQGTVLAELRQLTPTPLGIASDCTLCWRRFMVLPPLWRDKYAVILAVIRGMA